MSEANQTCAETGRAPIGRRHQFRHDFSRRFVAVVELGQGGGEGGGVGVSIFETRSAACDRHLHVNFRVEYGSRAGAVIAGVRSDKRGGKGLGEAELSERGVKCDIPVQTTEKQCELACRHRRFPHPTALVAKTAAIIDIRLYLR